MSSHDPADLHRADLGLPSRNPDGVILRPSPRAAHAPTEETLRKAGLRSTGPRRKVLELFLVAEQRHLTAEDVYRLLVEAGEQVSVATVYRVLAQFESTGLMLRHHVEGGRAVYELGRLGDHNHLICLQCGEMRCFTHAGIDRLQREVAAAHGFELRDYSLYAYVNCVRPDCPNKAAGKAPPPSTGEHPSGG